MKTPSSPKGWLSPFITIAFVVLAATGGLLFFHIKNGPIMALHEWFGWLFVVAGIVHLLLNLRALLAHLRRPAGVVSVAVALVLVAFLWLGGARHEGAHHRRGYGAERPGASSPSAMP